MKIVIDYKVGEKRIVVAEYTDEEREQLKNLANKQQSELDCDSQQQNTP